ncbi:unnamed protein product [Parnassius mnemosyne]|uniref:Uncharacterized protein n=1 Tax=Parnassius mnemosyne TaxID=213953 RepID=A0AAV1M9F4_9NEOP
MPRLTIAPVNRANRRTLGRRRLAPLGRKAETPTGEARLINENNIPNLHLVKLQAVCRHAILSRSAEHAKIFKGKFSLPFQVTTKLYDIRYVSAEDSDTCSGNMGSALK